MSSQNNINNTKYGTEVSDMISDDDKDTIISRADPEPEEKEEQVRLMKNSLSESMTQQVKSQKLKVLMAMQSQFLTNKYEIMENILIKKAVDKEHVEFEEDYVSLTVLSYLEENHGTLAITSLKQSQCLSNTLIIMTCQIMMLLCMLMNFIFDPNGKYDKGFSENYFVLLVKFPCTIGLHLFLYPEINKGLAIMKFANNQPEQFVKHGEKVSFILGFLQITISLWAQFTNIFLLLNNDSVEDSIIYFVSLKIILELSKLYLESQHDNHMHEVYHAHPKVINKKIPLLKRSCFHIVARCIYKVIRSIYVSIIFYFIPFSVYFVSFYYSDFSAEESEGGGGHH